MFTKKVLFILGPTSSGKTNLSLKLAKAFNGEIVNIDSQQAIRGLDIATAKVLPEEMQGIKHHMIDVYDFDEEVNVYKFCVDAEKRISEILQNDKLPIVVGGTGLYARVLSGSIALAEEDSVMPDLRKKLERLPLDKLIEHAKDIDVWGSLNDSDRSNKRRLIRAIEKQNTSIMQSKVFLDDYKVIKLALSPSTTLEPKIRQNVINMLKRGLLDETKMLLKEYPDFQVKVKAIGYKEAISYIKGEIGTEEELIDLITLHTRQYAKRQITWLKKEPDVNWIKSYNDANKLTKAFLQS